MTRAASDGWHDQVQRGLEMVLQYLRRGIAADPEGEPGEDERTSPEKRRRESLEEMLDGPKAPAAVCQGKYRIIRTIIQLPMQLSV